MEFSGGFCFWETRMRRRVQTQWDSKHKNEPLLCFVHVLLMQEGFTQLMCTGSARLMTSAMVKEQLHSCNSCNLKLHLY